MFSDSGKHMEEFSRNICNPRYGYVWQNFRNGYAITAVVGKRAVMEEAKAHLSGTFWRELNLQQLRLKNNERENPGKNHSIGIEMQKMERISLNT